MQNRLPQQEGTPAFDAIEEKEKRRQLLMNVRMNSLQMVLQSPFLLHLISCSFGPCEMLL